MSTIAATRSKTYDIVYIAVFAVIMAICSWISIPTAVPFTSADVWRFCSGRCPWWEKRNTFQYWYLFCLEQLEYRYLQDFLEALVFLLEQLADISLVFCFLPLLCGQWKNFRARNPLMQIVSMIVGLIVCYAFGTAWFMIVYSRANGAGRSCSCSWLVCHSHLSFRILLKLFWLMVFLRKLRKFVA